MANTPSLKASARLVLSMAPFSVMLLLAFVGGARHMLQTMLPAGIARTARFPATSLIHRSAWNRNSANFAFWGFSEVRIQDAAQPRPYAECILM
jgi:hypothetical protein